MAPYCRYAAGSWAPQLVQAAGGRDVMGSVREAVQFTPQQLRDTGAQVGLVVFPSISLNPGFDLI